MKNLAGIEYAGLPGISKPCKDAVIRYLQFGDEITGAKILSAKQEHCLLLTLGEERLVAIKRGFSSGYAGEGPGAFAYVLSVLEAHGAEIDEITVDEGILERIDQSALTKTDLDNLDQTPPIRPMRWFDYVYDVFKTTKAPTGLWAHFPPVIPFALIDSRILDLALRFWRSPDECLMTGYRRLEDTLRAKTGIREHGQKLFSQAFYVDEAKLVWKEVDPAEGKGRAQLFIGAYMAFRNRRAHKEPSENEHDVLDEFLLLNHLYKLEKEAIEASERA